MSQFIVDLWKEYGLFDLAVYATLCGLALQKLHTTLNARCPDDGYGRKNVDDENSLIERITHLMTTGSHIDPALPDTRIDRYPGYGFECKNLDLLTKSNNSTSAGAT